MLRPTEFKKLTQGNHLKFYRDGAGATVSVNSWSAGAEEHPNLKINGKPDAGTAEDVSTQLLLGHVPMLLRPDSHRRAGRTSAAWDLCQTAKEAGFVDRGVGNWDPVLEMTYRKVKYEIDRTSATTAK